MSPSFAILAVVFGALTAAPALAACDGTVGDSGRVSVDDRTILVRLPAGYDAKEPRPVLLVFHGFTMNASLMESMADFASAWPEAIVIYPQGLARRVDTMPGGPRPGWQFARGELGDRDLELFDETLAWLRAGHCIDEQRVFAAGYSNGGYFSQLLACERPAAVAGIASAAAGMACLPSTARPVLLSHGTRDAIVGYDQSLAAADTWARTNGCRGAPARGADGCSNADGCGGSPLVLCTHSGGHELAPGFPRTAVEFLKALAPER